MELLDESARSRLKWRCRRGLLENDLLIERFFRHHQNQLTPRLANALTRLMDLSDNDLLDLLLRRREPTGELDEPDIRQLLGLIRPAPAAISST